jgi:hypothetical protein
MKPNPGPREAEVVNRVTRRDPRTSTSRHRCSDVYCVLPQRSDTLYLYLQTCAYYHVTELATCNHHIEKPSLHVFYSTRAAFQDHDELKKVLNDVHRSLVILRNNIEPLI